MRLFSPLYRQAMVRAWHQHAPWYLGVMSFIESSFFPAPPDVMLAPMGLAQPRRAWHLALLTTRSSVAVPFTPASLVGRGGRLVLVAALMARGGAKMEAALHRYVDRLGWATVVLLLAGFLAYR